MWLQIGNARLTMDSFSHWLSLSVLLVQSVGLPLDLDHSPPDSVESGNTH